MDQSTRLEPNAAGVPVSAGGQQTFAVRPANNVAALQHARMYYASTAPILTVSDGTRCEAVVQSNLQRVSLDISNGGCANQAGLSQILANAHNACNIGLETHFAVLNHNSTVEEALKEIKKDIVSYYCAGCSVNAGHGDANHVPLLFRLEGQVAGLGSRLDEHANSHRSILKAVSVAEVQATQVAQRVNDIAATLGAMIEGHRIDFAILGANIEAIRAATEAIQRLETLVAQAEVRTNGKIDRLADRLAVLEVTNMSAHGQQGHGRARTFFTHRPSTPILASPVAGGSAVNGQAINGQAVNGNAAAYPASPSPRTPSSTRRARCRPSKSTRRIGGRM
ncbi:hypothetical protein AURDEDRAFT_129430 [Auricularia subglabra TFB-10046 SS5]|nr:hypothetical protein AURDEDRAFT_129430 [Auricularia subglabra TFB-10046 SS5]